tara:strand:- start:912 stop:1607 length:696 start_codon:yes stop_codon:yes gene_type:complete
MIYNKNIIKSSYKFISVIIILLLLLFASYFHNVSYKNNNLKNLNVLNQKITYHKNKEGKEIAAKLSLIGEIENLNFLVNSLKDSTKQLKKLVKNFKKVYTAVYSENIVKIDSIEIPYYIKTNDFNISFEVKKEFYSISGNSTNKGLSLKSISIPNKQSIVIGSKRSGFFKNDYKINIINSNPYIKTTKIDGYAFKEKKKRYGLGFHLGYGFNNLGTSPYIGFGVNYSLIRF